MKRISLVTEPDTLCTRPDGPATANIWLEIDGSPFPMVRWNDFAVVVMGWLAVALLRLVRGASDRETVHFMDGPYAVEIAISSAHVLRLRALKRGLAGTDEIARGEGPVMPFILGLISQSREVLGACKRQTWSSKDAEILESSTEALKTESMRLLS